MQTASRNGPHTNKGFQGDSGDRVSQHAGPGVAALSQSRCPRSSPTVSTMQRPGTAELSPREYARDTDSSQSTVCPPASHPAHRQPPIGHPFTTHQSTATCPFATTDTVPEMQQNALASKCPFCHSTCHACSKRGHIKTTFLCTQRQQSKTSPKTQQPNKVYVQTSQVDANNIFQCTGSSMPLMCVELTLNKADVVVEVDTGASVSLLSESTYRRL